ncbi:MAG: hypothetical protein HEP71_20420 [Roseivirga sp.]|nr:hypothetical protein [Roseivirga sp.]
MKDNKIDDLFRQKLGHQKLTPPPSAWASIEQNLPGEKKKGVYFWISIAASLLLICTLGWIMLSGDETTSTPGQTLASTEKQPELIKDNEQPNETLVTDNDTEPKELQIIKNDITEPALTQLMASADKNEKKDSPVITKTANEDNSTVNDINETINRRELLVISPIKLEDHLSINSMAREFNFDMIMPLQLTDYYIPYSEDLRPIPKKKKFRVLSGIISIAKEVNSSKLSLSELRNAKNNFVNDDLKYGSKSEEGVEDDSEEQPNKD